MPVTLDPPTFSVDVVPSFWTELGEIAERVKEEKTLFPVVKVAYICVPTFPYGQTTFLLRSLNKVRHNF
jgi:spermidine synthase